MFLIYIKNKKINLSKERKKKMSNFGPEYMSASECKNEYSVSTITDAVQNGEIVEVLVKQCLDNGTLMLSFGKNIKGIVNFEDVEYKTDGTEIKMIAALSKVGKTIKVIPTSITELDDGTYEVQCSRREAQKKCYEEYVSKLFPVML